MYKEKMTEETTRALETIKGMPFTKSWQNNHVSQSHDILNIDTGEVGQKELKDFIFLPAASALRHLSNDREFLAFRNDHKGDGMLDFSLIKDKSENENHRIVLLYMAIFLAELKIFFMIGGKYGIYIEISELHDKADENGGIYKTLYRHFSIPKQIAHKNGIVEAFS